MTLSALEHNPQADPLDVCKKLAEMGCKNIAVTMGEKGAYLFENGKGVYMPAYIVNCVDSTGAGDTFNGAVAASLSRGLSLSESVSVGIAASALSATKRGIIQANSR